MNPTPHQQRGLTLVELMIAMTLGLIVIGALIAVFVANNQTYRQNEALATLQDNARFALDVITRDLAMAGYWGGVRAVDAATSVRVSAVAKAAVSKTASEGDCGPSTQAASFYWLFDVATPLEFRNHLDPAALTTRFRCLQPANVRPDSDVLMIRRISGQQALLDPPGGTLTANRFYVKTNQNIASLFRASGSTFDRGTPADCPDGSGTNAPCPPLDTPQQVYAYTPQIYYVRNYLRTPGDGLPILCRRYLDDSASTAFMAEDCLAEGVENLQLEWGIGTGAVQRYVNDPTPAQLLEARSVRLHLLVRATSTRVQASNDAKTFTLADYTSPSEAGVLRRAFTTTVQLKNLQP